MLIRRMQGEAIALTVYKKRHVADLLRDLGFGHEYLAAGSGDGVQHGLQVVSSVE
jgi:predicted glycosyltransferase